MRPPKRCDEAVRHQNAQERTDERGADVVTDLFHRAVDVTHRDHDAEHGRDDAEAGQRVGRLLQRRQRQ